MALLDDWLSYVDDPSRFDRYHFESLMLELETRKHLEIAFSHLSGGLEFIERIIWLREQAAFNGTYLLSKPKEINSEIITLAELYRDCVADRLSELGDDEAVIIRKNPILKILKSQYKQYLKSGTLPFLEAMDTIGDDEIRVSSKKPRWRLGLHEAVYMMTTVPEVTRYIMSPFLHYPLNDEPATKLWLMGYRVDFTEDSTLLIMDDA
ncbi:hypothetical protein [Leisingera sp. ANG-M7]|uniref:hypothetical protein n=1 Tax=Leisingera sp. ANG-M7 TaxID=1577902 RepID=UPI0005807EC1|nr:hypothetical protein [Leisingera sp. ANG-M7]KIC39474.1 hypothetical protein RA26_02210 [Leisingera sp. ANG-M7]